MSTDPKEVEMAQEYDSAYEQDAYELGRERGTAAGTWVFDGNTSEDEIRRVLEGYEEGDPEIMDLEPSPLSGEWAGDPTPASVLSDLAGTAAWDAVFSDADAEGILGAYEHGFSRGFWDEVVRSGRAVL